MSSASPGTLARAPRRLAYPEKQRDSSYCNLSFRWKRNGRYRNTCPPSRPSPRSSFPSWRTCSREKCKSSGPRDVLSVDRIPPLSNLKCCGGGLGLCDKAEPLYLSSRGRGKTRQRDRRYRFEKERKKKICARELIRRRINRGTRIEESPFQIRPSYIVALRYFDVAAISGFALRELAQFPGESHSFGFPAPAPAKFHCYVAPS